MTKPYENAADRVSAVPHQDQSQKVRCDICRVWTPVDDIVWRGPDGTLAICDECQEEGDR